MGSIGEMVSYVCPRRHHSYQLPPGIEIRLILGAGEKLWDTNNLCPQCFVEWLNEAFPTEEVQK